MGAQLQPHHWRGIRIVSWWFTVTSSGLGPGDIQCLLKARKGCRDFGGEQGARDCAAVPHHLQQRQRDIAKHGDVAPGLGAECDQHLQPGGGLGELPVLQRSEAIIPGAEQADQADDDEIKRNDIVQQAGYDQNQNSRNQRYQGTNTQSHVHSSVFFQVKDCERTFFLKAHLLVESGGISVVRITGYAFYKVNVIGRRFRTHTNIAPAGHQSFPALSKEFPGWISRWRTTAISDGSASMVTIDSIKAQLSALANGRNVLNPSSCILKQKKQKRQESIDRVMQFKRKSTWQQKSINPNHPSFWQ